MPAALAAAPHKETANLAAMLGRNGMNKNDVSEYRTL
jgi:hypothetical protein